MGVYLFVYAILGFMPILLKKTNTLERKTKKYGAVLGCILLVLLLALRHQSMGVDLDYKSEIGYLASFDKINKFTWAEVFTLQWRNYERGYILYNKLIGFIWNERQFFLAVSALVAILPIAIVIYKKSVNTFFSYIVYMGLPVFLMSFSGIRQSIAIGICFLSVLFIQDKKWIKFIVAVLVASLFHYSAFIFLVAYPLYYLKFNKNGRVFSLLLIPIIYLLRYPLFTILSKLFKDEAIANDTGAVTLLLVFCLIYAFCFLFSGKDKETNGYLNLFYLACVCQVFGNVYQLAMRVGYYFMIFAILLIPKVIQEMNDDEETKSVVELVVFLAFIAYGLYALRNSSWAQTYPYNWFWTQI